MPETHSAHHHTAQAAKLLLLTLIPDNVVRCLPGGAFPRRLSRKCWPGVFEGAHQSITPPRNHTKRSSVRPIVFHRAPRHETVLSDIADRSTRTEPTRRKVCGCRATGDGACVSLSGPWAVVPGCRVAGGDSRFIDCALEKGQTEKARGTHTPPCPANRVPSLPCARVARGTARTSGARNRKVRHCSLPFPLFLVPLLLFGNIRLPSRPEGPAEIASRHPEARTVASVSEEKGVQVGCERRIL